MGRRAQWGYYDGTKDFFRALGKRQESPKFIHPSGYCQRVPARDEDHPAGACSHSLIIIITGVIGAHKIWVLSSSE